MSAKPVVFMFSGQGSQYPGMGRDLFERPGPFRATMVALDAIVRDLTGGSVVDCLYGNRSRAASFERIQMTHPAIFLVEIAMARTLMARGVVPDVVLGVSLGTFAAAVIAGCLAEEDALAAVVGQALAIETCCRPGAMVAVLADPALYEEEELRRECDLAAVNSRAHFVVAMPSDRLERVERFLKVRRVTYQRLSVPYAFHSRWIDEARGSFHAAMEMMRYRDAALPLVCCAVAGTLMRVSAGHLWRVAREPIRLAETIAHLEQRGSFRYLDAGPMGSLATCVKHMLPRTSDSETELTMSPFGSPASRVQAIYA